MYNIFHLLGACVKKFIFFLIFINSFCVTSFLISKYGYSEQTDLYKTNSGILDELSILNLDLSSPQFIDFTKKFQLIPKDPDEESQIIQAYIQNKIDGKEFLLNGGRPLISLYRLLYLKNFRVIEEVEKEDVYEMKISYDTVGKLRLKEVLSGNFNQEADDINYPVEISYTNVSKINYDIFAKAREIHKTLYRQVADFKSAEIQKIIPDINMNGFNIFVSFKNQPTEFYFYNIANDQSVNEKILSILEKKFGNKIKYLESKPPAFYSLEDFAQKAVFKNNNPQLNFKGVLLNYILLPVGNTYMGHFFDLLFIQVILGGFILTYLLYAGGSNNSNGVNAIKHEQIVGNINELIGMEDIKEEVNRIKHMYENKELYADVGVQKAFNILFSGPPGVGKSKMASYLAKSMNAELLTVNAANLETGFVGGGANTLKKLYKAAQKSKKCLVFIDEGQSLLMKRGLGKHKWEDETSNALLSILDGVQDSKEKDIITIVASNFDDQNLSMDEAMLRRFPIKINFRLPNLKERKDIIDFQISKIQQGKYNKKLNTDHLASLTEGLNPAVINNIIERASLDIVRDNKELTEDMLCHAFEKTLIGISDKETTLEKTNDRKVIAVHELGHFLTRFLINYHKNNFDIAKTRKEMDVIKISTEAISKSNALGYVLSKKPISLLQTRKDIEERIKVLYGGVANEELFFGKDNITTGSYQDIREVSQIFKLSITELSMYQNNKLNYQVLEEKSNSLKQIEEISNNLYQETLKILESHQKLTLYLYPILLAKFSLNVDEVLDCIQEYWIANLFFDGQYYLEQKIN